MFPTLLRRPRRGTRRVVDSNIRRASSISVPSPSLDPRRRAAADFTEADEYDDEDEEEEDDGPSPAPQFARRGHDRDQDNGEPAQEDEDGRQNALPVLPLFSSSHLG